MAKCRMELCVNWSGDGAVCPCAVLGMQAERDEARAMLNTAGRMLEEAEEQTDLANQALIAERESRVRLAEEAAEMTEQRDAAVSRWAKDSRNVRDRLDVLEARLARAVVLPDVMTMGDTFAGCTDINPDVCACADPGQPTCDACAEEIEPGQQYYMLHAPCFPWLSDDHPDQEITPTWWHVTCDARGVAAQPAEPPREAFEAADSPSPAPNELQTGCGSCYRCLEPTFPTLAGMRYQPYMIVCAECGNKRCPHATDHDHACTGSNESGQPGSNYAAPAPAAQPEPQDEEF